MKRITPKHIFEKNTQRWQNILRRLKSSSRIILFLDYDGTLVPFMENPSSAVLSEHMEMLLSDVNNSKIGCVFIVTGRAYSSINKIFRIKGITIVSNHGFQINSDKDLWVHPDLKRFIPSLSKIKVQLTNKLKQFPSTFVENKKFTLTVHFRYEEIKLIPLVKKIVLEIMKDYQSDFHTTSGKKILEVRPNIKWDKGEAVLKILSGLRIKKYETSIVYIGDDLTDEDAFEALKNNAITIVVGREHNSKADYFLRNISEVHKLISSIHALVQERG